MVRVVPTCINLGCGRPCATDGKRFRPVCSACHRHGGARPGVLAFKKHRCDNVDGRLGFTCFVDWSKVPSWFRITQLDHKDGNHLNNTPENVQELCNNCHGVKTLSQGDHKGYRYVCD